MKTAVALIACLASTVYDAAAQQQRFDGETLWRHVEVLAADDMEGRGTGTPGLERARAYVVDQLTEAGLAPAGVNGFFRGTLSPGQDPGHDSRPTGAITVRCRRVGKPR